MSKGNKLYLFEPDWSRTQPPQAQLEEEELEESHDESSQAVPAPVDYLGSRSRAATPEAEVPGRAASHGTLRSGAVPLSGVQAQDAVPAESTFRRVSMADRLLRDAKMVSLDLDDGPEDAERDLQALFVNERAAVVQCAMQRGFLRAVEEGRAAVADGADVGVRADALPDEREAAMVAAAEPTQDGAAPEEAAREEEQVEGEEEDGGESEEDEESQEDEDGGHGDEEEDMQEEAEEAAGVAAVAERRGRDPVVVFMDEGPVDDGGEEDDGMEEGEDSEVDAGHIPNRRRRLLVPMFPQPPHFSKAPPLPAPESVAAQSLLLQPQVSLSSFRCPGPQEIAFLFADETRGGKELSISPPRGGGIVGPVRVLKRK